MPPKTTSLNPRNSQNGDIFTVRPLPNPVSHKSFLRANVHRSVLAPLELKCGEICQISAQGSDNEDGALKWWPAVSWLAADPHLQRHAVLVSETVRALVGVGFENKVVLRRYQGNIGVAEKVTVREVPGDADVVGEGGGTLMRRGDREGWRFFLEHTLMETKIVFEGLTLQDIEFKRRKRCFRVEKITATAETTGSTSASDIKSSPVVPAFTMSESTSIKLITETIPEPARKEPRAKPVAITWSAKPLGPAKPAKCSDPPTVVSTASTPKVTFSSIGGLSAQIDSLRTLLVSVLEDADEFSRKGLVPPRGILLYGPPGTGKTMMLKAAASEINARAYVIDGKVVGRYVGESEAAIRKIFAEARKNQPSIIFMDEVDSLAPKRSQGERSEGRIVATLLTEMDGMESVAEAGSMRVAVVAATNRPNAIDEALRRAGRFERELEIGIPGVDARREILTLLMRKLDFEKDSGVTKKEFVAALSARTHGYVGADLEAVVRGGFTLALNRRRRDAAAAAATAARAVPTPDETIAAPDPPPTERDVTLIPADLEAALRAVKPTAMREIFIEPPKVRWSDIGGQEEVKQRLREAVEWPLTHPEVFARLGGTPRKGLLLYGPPGCSKTLTAKALATEAGLNFMAVKGPELFCMYVGESERAVREVFRKARAASPSVIFFDEIDALTASREDRSRDGGRNSGVNVLTALLNEMDGIETLKNVFVLAATNRPEIIDPALMRPGRLDTILYVGPPDLPARIEILKIKTRKMAISPDVDIVALAERLDGFSGAEIVNICDEAIHYAMRESFDIDAVGLSHFDRAVGKAVPQITQAMRWKYEQWSVSGVKKI